MSKNRRPPSSPNDDHRFIDSAAPPPHPHPKGGEAAESNQALPKRWSAARKVEIVIRLLKGESLDALAREIRQPASRIAEWRDRFLGGGEAAMKERSDDPAFVAHVELKRDLQAKVGQLTMEIELLYDRCHKLEAGLPPGLRRSRR